MTTLNKNYTRIEGTDAVSTIDDTNNTQLAEIEADMSTIETDLTKAQQDIAEKVDSPVTESDISLSDNTTNNASTTKHGFLKKLSGNSSQFLNGEGNFSTPAGGGDVLGPASNTDGKIPQWDGADSKTLKDGLDFKDEDDMASNSATAVPSQQSVKAYVDASSPDVATKAEAAAGTAIDKFLVPASIAGLYKPAEGTLINGRILPSVASNNLTVALKTLAGNDPSATDPVYVMIGGTLRSITSALSVTKNAGQNYSNAGGAELATKEVDWFVYLGWNTDLTPDAVSIGFSRIPYATVFSDFDTSSYAAEKNGHFSNDPGATDDVVNIGRFAATLSAGAGYTWSVPTYTTKNLIQRPIYETRWLDYVPVLTSGSADLSAYTYARYQIVGRNCRLLFDASGKNMGGSAGSTVITIPFASVYAHPINAGGYDGTNYVANFYASIGASSSATIFKAATNTNWTGSETNVYIQFTDIYEI